MGASAAVVVIAWSLTGQVYAAAGERHFSQFLVTNFPKPYDWVQQATGGESVVVIGQQIPTSPNSLWLTEFFNPSIEKIWSLDRGVESSLSQRLLGEVGCSSPCGKTTPTPRPSPPPPPWLGSGNPSAEGTGRSPARRRLRRPVACAVAEPQQRARTHDVNLSSADHDHLSATTNEGTTHMAHTPRSILCGRPTFASAATESRACTG